MGYENSHNVLFPPWNRTANHQEGGTRSSISDVKASFQLLFIGFECVLGYKLNQLRCQFVPPETRHLEHYMY